MLVLRHSVFWNGFCGLAGSFYKHLQIGPLLKILPVIQSNFLISGRMRMEKEMHVLFHNRDPSIISSKSGMILCLIFMVQYCSHWKDDNNIQAILAWQSIK